MLKKYFLILILLIFVIAGCKPQIPKENSVKIEPVKPGLDKKLTITFIPGINSPLNKAENITLQVLFVPVTPTEREILEKGKMVEIPMEKNGIEWEADLKPEKTAGAIVFQFYSGDKFDNNNKTGWDALFYNPAGVPVKGAYSALSQTFGSGMVSFLMNLKRFNDDSAMVFSRKELKQYPGNQRAKIAALFLRARKARKNKDKTAFAVLEKELDSYITEHPEDTGILELAYSYYFRSNPAKAEKILVQIKKINPLHRYLISKEITEIKKIKNVDVRVKKLLAMEKDVQNTNYYITWGRNVLKELSAAGKWQTLVDIAEKLIKRIESGAFIYPSYSKAKAKQTINSRLFTPLLSLAEAYYKLGDNKKAEDAYGKLGKLKLFPKQELVYKRNYLQFLVDTGQWDKAIDIGQKAIETANYDDKMIELFKTAYTNKTGNAQEAEQKIIEAKKKAGTFRKEEIEKMFITDAKPAPDFKLRDLNGKQISLSSLRGKTVIVDFWATWCGPCKASFPLLQKFWEQHRNNPDITVLAVNTQEQTKGKKRVDVVRKYMEEGKYGFPVLIDENNEVVKRFEVTGLPTKFFIGPDGKIYFKEVGFNGPGMVDDMNLMIKIIKDRVKIKK